MEAYPFYAIHHGDGDIGDAVLDPTRKGSVMWGDVLIVTDDTGRACHYMLVKQWRSVGLVILFESVNRCEAGSDTETVRHPMYGDIFS